MVLASNSNEIHTHLHPMKDLGAAERAKRIVKLLGFENGRQFALAAGISYASWNGIENGAPMSVSIYLKVARKCPGVTYDWLRFGNPAGLPLSLIKALDSVPIEPSSDGLNGDS